MSLRLFNSLTRQKEEFVPLEPGKVKMYVCGVTVYDFCHLGHARAYVVWDVVRRYLEFSGYQVCYVQNITDIDDKIIKRAQTEGVVRRGSRAVDFTEITDRYIQAYNEDMAKLNIKPADRYPRATEHIPQMIELIQSLIEKDIAYEAGGDVYYAVQKFPSYGKLSHRTLDSMQAGASGRVEDEPLKRYPFDFALWKLAKPGEPFWESPWGKGRPGWHIECSAMVKSCLGETIDIHAGGADLQFPHHENEIAQSEAATGAPLAKYWMHNGFVNISGEKMSKSLGNFKTIRSLLEYYHPMALRLFILQAHYRQPIDFTEEAIASASKSWQLLAGGLTFADDFPTLVDEEDQPLNQTYLAEFQSAMDDDFNTPMALSVVFDLAKTLKKERNLVTHGSQPHYDQKELKSIWQTFYTLCDVLGLAPPPQIRDYIPPQQPTSASFVEPIDKHKQLGITEETIEQLIAQRREAKKQKNYQEADRIRNELREKGIELIDLPGGVTKWKYKD
ncbi:MAG: cysteine--tRNA ligase [Pseudanabaenaceae cyanobacterium SKYGB_i_bin29]|nr:cysteine--tRNA ligase [Pseudanabaenaceae cyanobacterium SKYG29]MDW8420520.1 cysteine--tRNA ligase [Pseudanabaenaceae cyanobacterium SKYGB_i_bin29]